MEYRINQKRESRIWNLEFWTKSVLIAFVLLLSTFYILHSSFVHAATIGVPSKVIFSNGLTGYWTFDGKDISWGGSTVSDVSGHSDTGTMNFLTNTSAIAGKVGQAIRFDGNISSIILASSPIATVANPSSACAWVYTSDITLEPTAWNQTFLNIFVNGNNGIRFGNISPTGNLFVSYRSGGSFHGAQTSAGVFTKNAWNHVCYVWNGIGISLYANGVSLATSSNSESIGLENTIGAIDSLGDGNWYGGIDDMRVFSRALSAVEVRALYDSGISHTSASVPVAATPGCTSGLSCGLLGWWTFDGKNMIQNVADSSGLGNNGSLMNFTSTTTVSGKIGQGLNFDGVDDYVVVKSSSGLINGIGPSTICAWSKTKNTTNNADVYTEGNISNGTPNYIMRINAAGKLLVINQSDVGTNNVFTSSGSVNDDKWHHLCSTIDNSGKITAVYIDSTNIGSATTNTLISAPKTTATIGAYLNQLVPTGFQFFIGSLDDVRVYNRALSAAEVKELYASGASTFAASQNVGQTTGCVAGLSCGLVGYWTFDGKNMIQNVTDSSGQGNNGSLHNFTSTTTVIAQGKVGQGLKLTGASSNYVDFGNKSAFNLSTKGTISIWVKFLPQPGVYADILGNASFDNDTNGYMVWINLANNIVFEVDNTTVSQSVGDFNPVGYADNKWHQMTGTWEQGGNISLYIDGVLIDSHAISTGANVISNLALGYAAPEGNYFFTGSVDDFRIYNRALSASEVLQLYNGGR